MHSRLRHYATLLALCAMLLRGALPLGWMPTADGGVLTLCTANGLVQVSLPTSGENPDPQAPHDTRTAQQALCPFAAAGSPGGAPPAQVLPDGQPFASAVESIYSSPFLEHRAAGNTLARAPPTLLNRA